MAGFTGPGRGGAGGAVGLETKVCSSRDGTVSNCSTDKLAPFWNCSSLPLPPPVTTQDPGSQLPPPAAPTPKLPMMQNRVALHSGCRVQRCSEGCRRPGATDRSLEQQGLTSQKLSLLHSEQQAQHSEQRPCRPKGQDASPNECSWPHLVAGNLPQDP